MRRGQALSASDQKRYSNYIDKLTDAASKLAKLEEQKAESLLSAYTERSGSFEYSDHIKGIQSKIQAFGGFKGPKPADVSKGSMEKGSSKVTEEPVKEEKPATLVNNKEEDKESAQTSSFELEKGSDSVSVNTPPPDASIAEAKPVALSVAGVGGVASAKPIATAVVGPGGLAVSRPIATAIAGIDPDEVSGLGIPIKKVKKTSSATLFNFELANKIKKDYGVGNDAEKGGRESEENDSDETYPFLQKAVEPNTSPVSAELPEQVAQVGAMLQPNLDPYKLIPSQFHSTFNIKPQYELITSRGKPDPNEEILAEERTGAESNLQPEGIQIGRIAPGAPWMYLPYSFYSPGPYQRVHYTY